MKKITGETKLLGVVADPIHHVKTPQRMNEHLQEIGYDGIVVPLHVLPANLETALAGLRHTENFLGAVITVPHKTAVLALCDDATDAAKNIGAANVIRREADGRLTAHMLDGEGFVRGMQSCGHQVTGRSCYLAGAGGAANAIAFSLLQHGASHLTIANRTKSKAEELQQRLLRFYPNARIRIGSPDPSGHNIVINATSLGLRHNDALPLNASALTPDQLVCEIIMSPKQTPLLDQALQQGCTVHYGAPMLACQIQAMAEFMGATPA